MRRLILISLFCFTLLHCVVASRLYSWWSGSENPQSSLNNEALSDILIALFQPCKILNSLELRDKLPKLPSEFLQDLVKIIEKFPKRACLAVALLKALDDPDYEEFIQLLNDEDDSFIAASLRNEIEDFNLKKIVKRNIHDDSKLIDLFALYMNFNSEFMGFDKFFLDILPSQISRKRQDDLRSVYISSILMEASDIEEGSMADIYARQNLYVLPTSSLRIFHERLDMPEKRPIMLGILTRCDLFKNYIHFTNLINDNVEALYSIQLGVAVHKIRGDREDVFSKILRKCIIHPRFILPLLQNYYHPMFLDELQEFEESLYSQFSVYAVGIIQRTFKKDADLARIDADTSMHLCRGMLNFEQCYHTLKEVAMGRAPAPRISTKHVKEPFYSVFDEYGSSSSSSSTSLDSDSNLLPSDMEDMLWADKDFKSGWSCQIL